MCGCVLGNFGTLHPNTTPKYYTLTPLYMRKPVTYYMPVCVTDFDTLHPNTTPKHYTLVGFFIFSISLGTCPRLCSSVRTVDCAASFPKLTRLRVSFFLGGDFKLGFKILTPAKTMRKAATIRFVVSPLVLDCIRGSYMGFFRGLNFNHVILSSKSKLHLDFTNVPHAVH